MQIGDYTVSTVIHGTFGLDGGAMFGIVPKVLWNSRNPADDKNRIDLSTRSLLIEGNGHKILVDTGMGDKWDDKHRNIYKIDNESTNVYSSLEGKGLSVDEITDVIITHLHFDHAGGATKYNDDGDLVPTFPNATYYVQQKNWDWAENPSEKDAASYLPENFQPLYDHSVLEILDGPAELFPGIELMTSDGHTVGQQHPIVKSADQSIFYCGDLIPTRTHIPIPWVMGYDLFPLTTIQEKKDVLSRALEENWILFFEHDPVTNSVTVQQTEKGIRADQTISI